MAKRFRLTDHVHVRNTLVGRMDDVVTAEDLARNVLAALISTGGAVEHPSDEEPAPAPQTTAPRAAPADKRRRGPREGADV